jgi:hypothetical protein
VRDHLLLIGIEWDLDRDTLHRHPTPASLHGVADFLR